MGPGQKILIRVVSGQPFLAWVWKISHKNPNFSIFSLRFKKNLIGSGQRQVGLLFTAIQKYARVGSGLRLSLKIAEPLTQLRQKPSMIKPYYYHNKL